jgi:hypothetical protein
MTLGRSDDMVFSCQFGESIRLVALASLFQLLTAASAHAAEPDREAGNWRSYFGNDKAICKWIVEEDAPSDLFSL